MGDVFGVQAFLARLHSFDKNAGQRALGNAKLLRIFLVFSTVAEFGDLEFYITARIGAIRAVLPESRQPRRNVRTQTRLLFNVLLLALRAITDSLFLFQCDSAFAKSGTLAKPVKRVGSLAIFLPGTIRIARDLEGLRALLNLSGLSFHEIRVACFVAIFHGDQAKPGQRLVHYVGWRPLVGTIEPAQRVRIMKRAECRVEIEDLTIIEVESAHGRKDRKRCVRCRRPRGRKAGTVQKHTCGAIALLRKRGSKASTSRKPREIDTVVIDSKACMSVLKHGLGGVRLRFPGAVVRIVRARHDVAVALRRVLHQFDRHAATGAGIERVDNWPAFFASVMRGKVERIALVGWRCTSYFGEEKTSGQILRRRIRGSALLRHGLSGKGGQHGAN